MNDVTQPDAFKQLHEHLNTFRDLSLAAQVLPKQEGATYIKPNGLMGHVYKIECVTGDRTLPRVQVDIKIMSKAQELLEAIAKCETKLALLEQNAKAVRAVLRGIVVELFKGSES